MIRLFSMIGVLLLAVCAGVYLKDDPGLVLITFKHWVIEANFWFFLFVLALSLFLLSFVISILRSLIKLPHRLYHNYQRKKERHRERVTEEGFRALSTQNWKKLMMLFPEFKKTHVLSDEVIQKLCFESAVYETKMLSETLPKNDFLKFIATLPKDWQNRPEIIKYHAEVLIESGDVKRGAHLIFKSLRKQYSEELVLLYIRSQDHKEAIHFMEKLVKKYPKSAELYASLGAYYRETKLWGRSKNALEESIGIKETPKAYQELGKLYECLGEEEKSRYCFLRGLELALPS